MSALRIADAPPASRLDELADAINAEHGHMGAFLGKALQHAIRCGSALLEARALLERGRWLPWLERNIDISQASAHMYMRIAANCEALAEHDVGTIKDASEFLAKHHLRLQITADQKAEMLALSKRGLTQKSIARTLGVSQSSVARHLGDPDLGSRPRPTDNFEQRWQPRRGLNIDDEMIERTARWLCERYDLGPVTDAVRNEALELLGVALGIA